MKRHLIFYGLLAFSLLMLFQISSMWIFRHKAATEWVLVPVALVSIGMGIFYGRNRGADPAKAETPTLRAYEELGITGREFEVLKLLDHGLSNKEVGEKLFISENTVKTHVSNLLLKLDAKRRTQALKNAKDLKII